MTVLKFKVGRTNENKWILQYHVAYLKMAFFINKKILKLSSWLQIFMDGSVVFADSERGTSNILSPAATVDLAYLSML